MGTRTHSIWLSQLLLAIVVVIVVLLVQALSPATLDLWTFTIGVSMVVVLTAVALAIPWNRVAPMWVLAIPALDALAVGVMTRDTTIDFAFLWVFPVSWIAMHFPMWATGTTLVGIATMVILEEAQHPENANGTMRLIIVTLSLTFIAISMQSTSRQTRAFKRLLRREASKLNETLSRAKRQEREVSRVLGSIDVGVVRISSDGGLLEVNKTYHDLYDIVPNDLAFTARSVEYDDYQGSPLGLSERPLARARGGQQFQDVRTWLFTSDGTWRALSLSAMKLPDDHGLAVGESLLVAHDISAMMTAEKGRESIAARVSHELRNPLTTILGYSDLLLDDPAVDARVRERVEAINAGAERMMVLANQILDAGRQGRLAEAPLTRVDLGRLVAESVESFTPTAQVGGVTLVFAAADDVSVLGDAFRLRQVSDNLLSNAIKYTPKGGRIIIDVHRAWGADAAAAPGADPEVHGDRAVLQISDTGVGMEPQDVARIFEPYFRAASAEQSDIVGTGLGMGIVKSLVERHSGTITVESTLGAGTTATVDLPAESAAAESSVASAVDGRPGKATADA
ncbi:sensor histidine kinase [Microbacterium sp. CJ88]|uniref:sensor histidine kinase n=1 Tax=Microbacterium sp. CJ88 TaxID=3445672 RepID=UPI003F65F094